MMLSDQFFSGDAVAVAQALLGKVMRVKYDESTWLSVSIIETEAYYLHDKASHASLGYTTKRKALFMPPGTIYMYYSRAGDSINVSCLGDGCAVLIKAGYPYLADISEQAAPRVLAVMQRLCMINNRNNVSVAHLRPIERLCSGQALLCRSLGLKVKDWDQKNFDINRFYIDDVGYCPKKIIQTPRLGIKTGRDEHLPYRFIDAAKAKYCTRDSR